MLVGATACCAAKLGTGKKRGDVELGATGVEAEEGGGLVISHRVVICMPKQCGARGHWGEADTKI